MLYGIVWQVWPVMLCSVHVSGIHVLFLSDTIVSVDLFWGSNTVQSCSFPSLHLSPITKLRIKVFSHRDWCYTCQVIHHVVWHCIYCMASVASFLVWNSLEESVLYCHSLWHADDGFTVQVLKVQYLSIAGGECPLLVVYCNDVICGLSSPSRSQKSCTSY